MTETRLIPSRVQVGSRADLFGDDPLSVSARSLELVEPQPSRRVDALTITLVEDGRLVKVMADRTIPLARGQLVICESGMAASHLPLEPTRLVSVYLGQDILSRMAWLDDVPGYTQLMDRLFGGPSPQLPVVAELHPAMIETVARTMRAVAEPAPTAERPRVFSRLARLLDLLEALQLALTDDLPAGVQPAVLAHSFGAAPGRQVRPEVGHAIRLLHAHPEFAWSLRELARQVHLSPAQLLRSFGREVGATPIRLLREIRVERIAELLRTESISFAAAVRRAGWVDTHHARRLFRERWRQSPAEYRAGADQARGAANSADSLTS